MTSLPPAEKVIRSGLSAIAGSTWVSTICPMSFPRTARFAYAKSSTCCESTSATRSAQPRWPLGESGSGSPIPSVNESPSAT